MECLDKHEKNRDNCVVYGFVENVYTFVYACCKDYCIRDDWLYQMIIRHIYVLVIAWLLSYR